ncbi:MAG: hypothetical protein WCW04_03765 [Candidatus Paceibacterota bacterium]|jgi:hypothetical protein
MKINTATEVTEKIVKIENKVVNIQLTPREAFLLTAFIGNSREFTQTISGYLGYHASKHCEEFVKNDREDRRFFDTLFSELDDEVSQLPNVN